MDRREYLRTVAAGTLSTGLLLDACKQDTDTIKTGTQLNHSLSQRGLKASQTVLRVDMDLYFEAVRNLYHPTQNPSGAFPLNVAENKLSWAMLRQQMELVSRQNPIQDWVANYTDSVGAPTSRKVMAEFMSKFLTHCSIDPDLIALSPGATGVIDLSSWILGEPDDVAVFPAPCYPVYSQDIGNKAGLERYDLITHHDLPEISNGPLLSIQHLEEALKKIESQGKRFRILVLTTPDNPTGAIYSKQQLLEFTDWCLDRNIHLVVNEIYGLSLINTQHPELQSDYSDDVTFYSFANIMLEKKSEYLHHWYALSKDFGASGFRVGVLHTWNKTFLSAYNNLNAPSMVSNYAQWIFELVLADHTFLENYIKTNQNLLTENYSVVINTLRKMNIPYVPARGSLFVWLDLSELMKANTKEDEVELWMDLFKGPGILLTPGDGFGHSKLGQFRLVYSYVAKADLEVAMTRLESYINSKRSQS